MQRSDMKFEFEMVRFTIDDGDMSLTSPYILTSCKPIKPRRARKKKVKVASLIDEIINDLQLDSEVS